MPTDDLETRRRAPYWVRSFSDIALHRLAGKLHRDLTYGEGLTSKEDWLLEISINELEYRSRRDRRAGIKPCSCEYCCGPFDLFDIDGGA